MSLRPGLPLILAMTLLVSSAWAGDVIINEHGYTEGNEYQRAVFVSVFLPEDMVCSQPVQFVRPASQPEPEPEPEVVTCGDGGLVISPAVCEKE